jgi:predicted Ser/Thr protein kinase
VEKDTDDPWLAARARAAASPRASVRSTFGPYEIRAPLGRGAFGEVYRAHDPRHARDVAIKVLSRPTERARDRFSREVQATARLRHPGIVTLLDSGVEGETPFMVMELVEGRPFDQLCDSASPPPLRERVRLVQEIAEAVHYAHGQGVLHRDLKPENVLVDPEGRARVVDFGLARLQDRRTRLTHAGDVLGTPAYMSPEQAGAHGGHVDARTDVYALGATLYHAITGVPPFQGRDAMQVFVALLGKEPEPPSELAPEVSRELEAVCLRCLAKEPDLRYPDAASVALELGRWLRGEQVQAGATSSVERLKVLARRHWLPLITGLLGVVLGVVIALVVTSLRASAPGLPAVAQASDLDALRLEDELRARGAGALPSHEPGVVVDGQGEAPVSEGHEPAPAKRRDDPPAPPGFDAETGGERDRRGEAGPPDAPVGKPAGLSGGGRLPEVGFGGEDGGAGALGAVASKDEPAGTPSEAQAAGLREAPSASPAEPAVSRSRLTDDAARALLLLLASTLAMGALGVFTALGAGRRRRHRLAEAAARRWAEGRADERDGVARA